ncbi:LamG domain-containing protein [Glycomyces xiaoerkulensis]|uniref:LamG domain-containing protein n=1 Tax=Glycomyces xiaoerkulensis TaxID=2038139 RepID=UPI0013000C95|nr:LamG domain-containing protein [Glycomyces xiaoerkulensis]
MKRPHAPGFVHRGLGLGLTAVIGAALLIDTPASAQDIDESTCSESTDLQERSESSALSLAAECSAEVLIRDSVGYTTSSYAQPDGSVSTAFTVEPQWVPDQAGEWVDADTTLEVDENGTIRSKATVSDLAFGSGGESEFVTATNREGEAVTLSWGEPLPEPVIDGDTITYPEVLPEIDLQAHAEVTGFSYALVVKTPEAATNPALKRVELGFKSHGLSVASDNAADTASLADKSGRPAFTVESPWMWDSSATDAGIPEHAAPMELEMDDDSLTVIPDQDLLSDPEAEFPIYIDPKFRDEGANFANAYSRTTGITCGTGSEMCTGRQTWASDSTYGAWRSAMKFNGLQAIADREVQQTTVWITQTHTGDAGSTQKVRLAAMDWFDMSSDITWDDFNDQIVGEVARDSVPTSHTGADEPDQEIRWADDRTADRIQELVDRGNNTAVFAALSGANWDQEEHRDYWRKLDPSSAKMIVWHAPLKATNLYTDGDACSTSAPGPTINDLTPTFKATAPKSLEPDNRVSFYLYERDKSHPSMLEQIDTHDVADGQVLRVSVASGKLERGRTYRWNVRARDSDAESSRYGQFSSYCYFTVNSLPEAPTAQSTEGQGCGTESDPTLVTTRTPKLAAAPRDPDGGAVELRYLFYKPSGSNIENWYVDAQAGQSTPSRLASGVVTEDGLYRWRAQTFDAFTHSSKSEFCYVRIDTTAPEPPDVARVTANPLPGDPVEFEFVGGDDVTGFEYALEGETKQAVSAADGQTKVSVTPSTGSVDHAIQVWAVDSAGNTSSPTTYWFTTVETQPAEAIGAWRFDGDGLDDAADSSLSALESAVYGPDREGRTDAAAVFDGASDTCMVADEPIVNASDSFTVAAWAYIEAPPSSGSPVVMGATGQSRSNLKLFMSSTNAWGASMYSSDTADVTAVTVFAESSNTEFSSWTHVAAAYDAPAERLRLYVNGQLVASDPVPFDPWAPTGRFAVGCGAKGNGATFHPMTGSVDDAVVFNDILTGEQLSELMDGNGMPSAVQAWYPLRGDGADVSGRGTDLTAMPTAPTWGPDQYGRAQSALQFDGSTCPTADTVPVRTDEAFTVSAWAWLDAEHTSGHPRLFSFNGAQYFSVMTKYSANSDTWTVGVTSQDSADADWGDGAVSAEAAVKEKWTHFAVTVDPDNALLQLFIDGELSDTGTIAMDWEPWRAGEFVIGCGGVEDGSRWTEWEGSISDVRLWRGALDADEVAAAHTERLSHWELGRDELGVDLWGADDLTLNGEYSWEVDRYNDCWAAYGLALGGTGWAETTGPVITTDESFTVAGWARVDDLDDYRTIVSQTGDEFGAFNLVYSPVAGRFQLSMPSAGSGDGPWTLAYAEDPPEIDESTGVGKWYHLVGQVDLGAGVIRLYVDGELQDEAPVVASPWKATGPLTIGAAEQQGEMTNQMVGAIDSVRTWSGVLDELSIQALAADRPQFEQDPDDADCSDSEEPPPL